MTDKTESIPAKVRTIWCVEYKNKRDYFDTESGAKEFIEVLGKWNETGTITQYVDKWLADHWEKQAKYLEAQIYQESLPSGFDEKLKAEIRDILSRHFGPTNSRQERANLEMCQYYAEQVLREYLTTHLGVTLAAPKESLPLSPLDGFGEALKTIRNERPEGFKLIVDPSVPPDEVHIRDSETGALLAKTVNLGVTPTANQESLPKRLRDEKLGVEIQAINTLADDLEDYARWQWGERKIDVNARERCLAIVRALRDVTARLNLIAGSLERQSVESEDKT